VAFVLVTESLLGGTSTLNWQTATTRIENASKGLAFLRSISSMAIKRHITQKDRGVADYYEGKSCVLSLFILLRLEFLPRSDINVDRRNLNADLP
jgi:hypothetical protein